MSNSPFAYCANNPISRVDPFGLEWKDTNNDGIADYWWVEEPIIVTAESEEELSFDGVGERVTFMYGIFKNEGYHSLMSSYRKFRPNFEFAEKAALTGSSIAVGVIGAGSISQLCSLYGTELTQLGLTSQQQIQAWISTVGVSNARLILMAVKLKAAEHYKLAIAQYYAHHQTINDTILGVGSGANFIDYVPKSWPGWGGFIIGNLLGP
jgi:hypothetical protein